MLKMLKRRKKKQKQIRKKIYNIKSNRKISHNIVTKDKKITN